MKILVTGCGISGTVLLTRLMSTFDNILEDNQVGHPKEVFQGTKLRQYMLMDDSDKVLIRKGNHGMLFNGIIDEQEQEKQATRIYPKLKVINIIRNGRDVLESKPVPGIANLWIACIDQYFNYNHVIDANVRFEELLQSPDDVQDSLGEQLEFKWSHRFSSYPKFLQPPFTWSIKASHKLRTLDTTRINKQVSESAIKSICGSKYSHFCELQERLGYD